MRNIRSRPTGGRPLLPSDKRARSAHTGQTMAQPDPSRTERLLSSRRLGVSVKAARGESHLFNRSVPFVRSSLLTA